MLQYFDRERAVVLLNRWKKVLKPNGILRLVVPNFETVVEIYNRGAALKLLQGPLYGIMEMGDKIIHHKTAYDYKELKDILKKVGFNGIIKKPYFNETKDQSDLNLNIECTKNG
jgi:predicted SAM-dependent methyltransferase